METATLLWYTWLVSATVLNFLVLTYVARNVWPLQKRDSGPPASVRLGSVVFVAVAACACVASSRVPSPRL